MTLNFLGPNWRYHEILYNFLDIFIGVVTKAEQLFHISKVVTVQYKKYDKFQLTSNESAARDVDELLLCSYPDSSKVMVNVISSS